MRRNPPTGFDLELYLSDLWFKIPGDFLAAASCLTWL